MANKNISLYKNRLYPYPDLYGGIGCISIAKWWKFWLFCMILQSSWSSMHIAYLNCQLQFYDVWKTKRKELITVFYTFYFVDFNTISCQRAVVRYPLHYPKISLVGIQMIYRLCIFIWVQKTFTDFLCYYVIVHLDASLSLQTWTCVRLSWSC